MRRILLPILSAALVLGPASAAHGLGTENAVYVYDLFRQADNCLELFTRLRHLSLRPSVILSIEQGPEFLLDQEGGEERLACVLQFLNGTKRQVKALFLQDPVFLENVAEAERRAQRLGEFIAEHPGELAGVQVDAEPHSDKRWTDAEAAERKQMISSLQQLLRRVRPHVGETPLSVVLPWWYAHITEEVEEASPKAMFGAADEVYLMSYGDEEPETVDTAGAARARLGAAFAFSERGATHVILAKHEFASRGRLERELQKLRRTLASSPNFAGTAVFHATSSFRTQPRHAREQKRPEQR